MRLAAAPAAIALAACGKEKPPPEPVRPVLAIPAALHTDRTYDFAGSIEPRYKVEQAFRVMGRVISRDVEVGDTVRKGEEIAAIDPTTLQLALRSAIASVSAARSQLANNTGEEGRQRYLVERNVVPQAQFEGAQAAQATSAASARAAEANLQKASEQLTYAKLTSDMDGVVTAVNAQVGEVVNVGQSVMTIARPDVREAAVDVSEDVAQQLAPGTHFEISLVLDPKIRMAGEVREVQPAADSSTRTRHVLISLPGAGPAFRLGTTITAHLTLPGKPTILLPRSALLEQDGKTFVWILDAQGKSVSTAEVELAGQNDTTIEVAGGIDPGSRVVIAGVHSLSSGQAVRVADEGKH